MVFKVVSPENKYKDNDTYRTIVNYCLNPFKAPHAFVVGFNLDMDHAEQDMYELSQQFNKLKGTRIRHMVLTFDPEKEKGISHEDAFYIAKKTCKYYASDYQIFAVVHENREHVHIHIIMNTVRIHDGEKYKGRKKDYYAFQEHLRKTIRPFGLKLKVTSDD